MYNIIIKIVNTMTSVQVVFTKNTREAQFFNTESNAQEFLDDVANNPDKYVIAK